MPVSKPNQFKKSDKPKTRREDRVDEDKKEKIVVKWYKKEPWSTISFNAFVALGGIVTVVAFGCTHNIIPKFIAFNFISYMFFEELPGLYRRFVK